MKFSVFDFSVIVVLLLFIHSIFRKEDRTNAKCMYVLFKYVKIIILYPCLFQMFEYVSSFGLVNYRQKGVI